MFCVKGTCNRRISLPGANYVSIVYMTIDILYLVLYCRGYRDSPAVTLTFISCVEGALDRFLRFLSQDLWILTPLVMKHLTFL